MFKMFHLFQTYVCKRFDLDVAYVSHMLQEYIPNVSVLCYSKCFHVVSCKCLSGRCICCNGYTRMLQMYVSAVFISMLQVFYLDIAYVVVAIHICCKRMFSNVSFVSD